MFDAYCCAFARVFDGGLILLPLTKRLLSFILHVLHPIHVIL